MAKQPEAYGGIPANPEVPLSGVSPNQAHWTSKLPKSFTVMEPSHALLKPLVAGLVGLQGQLVGPVRSGLAAYGHQNFVEVMLADGRHGYIPVQSVKG